jgi:dihydroorotate dehydrogenase subfamily 1
MNILKTNVFGLTANNPLFTAAGPTAANYDLLKNAVDGGAGGIVTKTISVKPAKVPVPNIYSTAPGSLINAELWSEYDYKYFIDVELPKIKSLGVPVILSLGYTASDMLELGSYLKNNNNFDAVEFSIHYVSKDISNITDIASSIKENIAVPVIAKFSPSIGDIAGLVKALEPIVDGFAAINSVGPTYDFDINTLKPYMGSIDGRGWLSGRAILPIGLHFVATIAANTKKPVFGVGGIRTHEDVIKYLMAGARAVQICSHAILNGPTVYEKINKNIVKWLEQHSYNSLDDIIGLMTNYKLEKVNYLLDTPEIKPVWNENNCNLCKSCATVCTHNAITFNDKKLMIDYNKCVSCGLCTTTCPHNALTLCEINN